MGNSPQIGFINRPQKGSLPKLSQILQEKKSVEKKVRRARGNLGNGGLMIEGRSKIIEDARSYERGGKNIDK